MSVRIIHNKISCQTRHIYQVSTLVDHQKPDNCIELSSLSQFLSQVRKVPKFRSSGHIVNVNTCTMLKHMRPWWLCLTLDAKFELEGPNYAQTKF